MPPISIMVKPSSSHCNLECKYCFYHSLSSQRKKYAYDFMDEELMGNIIKKACEFTRGDRIYLSFQGGEPLLIGKNFYKSLPQFIQLYNIYNSPINIVIQTNGTLIDEEWCSIFKKDNYLIGISLDGDELANKYRKDKQGKDTFDKVLCSINLLKKYNIDYNILSVITSYVAENIENIYSFFKSQGYKHLQFMPCLRPLGSNKEKNELYMTEKQYGDFLIKLFKLYYNDYINNQYCSIRQFDNFVCLVANKEAEQCGMNGHCNVQFVIESNGNVYPCDYYCLDEYQLGNINQNDFFDFSHNDRLINFIKESLIVEDKCKKCKYFKLCGDGCKRERECVDKCEAYQRFFSFVVPYLENLTIGLR